MSDEEIKKEEELKTKMGDDWVQFHIELALQGYPYYSRGLLKMVVKLIEADKPLRKPLKEHFLRALKVIADGGDANLAFILKGKQGRSASSRLREYDIARTFRVEKNRGKSSEEILQALHESGNEIDLRRAQQIHKEFQAVLDFEESEGALPSKKTK